MITVCRSAASALVVLGLFVTGCAKERHEEIPPSAMLATQGTDKVEYLATDPGMVYIYDATVGKLIYSGEVRSGQRVMIDPQPDKVMVDGATVTEAKLRAGNNHKIFFMPRKSGTSDSGAMHNGGHHDTMDHGGHMKDAHGGSSHGSGDMGR